ncbi:MAG: ABC transporter permease [Betaproteobacteria bacterium]
MSRLRLVPRTQPSRPMLFAAPLIAVALTLIVGLAVFAWLGQNPVHAFRVYFIDPVSDMNGVAELLLKASPLCLIALGLAIGFRAGIWNIGAEGQMYLGGIFATGLAIQFSDVPDMPKAGGMWLLPAMIVLGAVGGMLWASITAFLRAQFHANEILVSLMFTYVADLLVKFLVYGPWQDPQANNFPITVSFPDNALFPLLASWGWSWFDGTRINASVFITLAALPIAWVFLERSFLGFQLRVTGLAPGAARYAGFPEKRMIWLALLISGAAAGLAGVSEVAGPIGQLNDRWAPGYGFTAIIVAALGRMNAIGILLAALLMALLYLGGEAVQISLQLPKAISLVFQGLLLMFLLGCDVLVNYRVVRVASATTAPGGSHA